MPEWDSAYGASSKASFDAGKAPKGTYGGNGNKSTVTHTSTGNTNLQKVSTLGTTANFLRTGNPIGYVWQGIKKMIKPKKKEPTLTEKTAAMEDAYVKPRVYKGPEGNGGNGIKSLGTTAPVGAVTSASDDDFSWNFQPYPARHGKFMRAKGLSGGKRFGPPPLKGPDPQGLDVVLSNTEYFKDLVK
jgi:hypothetical protein